MFGACPPDLGEPTAMLGDEDSSDQIRFRSLLHAFAVWARRHPNKTGWRVSRKRRRLVSAKRTASLSHSRRCSAPRPTHPRVSCS